MAVLSLAAVGCSGGGDDDGSDTPEGPSEVIGGVEIPLVPATVPTALTPDLDPGIRERIVDAVASGSTFAGSHLEDADPATLAFFDYLWRNWGVEEFSDARAAAQGVPRPDEGEQALFLRLVHSADPLPNVPAGETVPPTLWALHCDQEPLPPEFADRLADQVRDGGVNNLLHAAYGTVWAGELGCMAPDLEELATAIINGLLRELNERTEVDHDALLLSVGLTYLGRADLVPSDWLVQVLEAQREDGGWAQDIGDDASSWHTTGVALWTLLGSASPGTGAPMVLVD